jgi:nucleotide-binding universal stress UspA family protein
MKAKPPIKSGRTVRELKGADEKFLTDVPADEPFKIKKILVPVDFSPLSKKALRYAVPFARQHQARLVLVHAVEPVLYPENYIGALPPDIEDVNISRAKAAKKQLAAVCEDEVAKAIASETVVHIGRPYEEIISIAKDQNADLIIIATHGRKGLKHAFLGSTAERVVRHAPCPVLVVRERENDFV